MKHIKIINLQRKLDDAKIEYRRACKNSLKAMPENMREAGEREKKARQEYKDVMIDVFASKAGE